MLTRIEIRNFKRFDDIDIELGDAVVFVGPNNSGKTTALQALALWDIGVRKWLSSRGGKVSPEKRPGVAINRRDLISIPVPVANLLWRGLHVRRGKLNVRIEIVAHGVREGKEWSCGMEFDYANEESFSCRPVRNSKQEDTLVKDTQFSSIPSDFTPLRVAFLPPMSGLSANEPKWESGRINVLLGEGRTAEVLRNLCFNIYESDPSDKPSSDWNQMSQHIKRLFGVRLSPPRHLIERGEITMSFSDQSDTVLDLSSCGRGLQQTLLLLAHLYANKESVLLLDEPDAHLEMLRQQQIYQLLTDIAKSKGSQIIAATHSEVILDEAADRDIVVAFVGKPHRIDDRGAQVRKALRKIGYDSYYKAEQKGWVLYLEGPTDLAILQAFAKTLEHPAIEYLDRPFVEYVANQPNKVKEHFFALLEAKSNLVGIAVFDRFDHRESPVSNPNLVFREWTKKEIENYICSPEVLITYARDDASANDLFSSAEAVNREQTMRSTIADFERSLQTIQKPSPWSDDIKASDEFLDPLFKNYFASINLPNLMRKTDYHRLADLVSKEFIHKDIIDCLDAISEVANRAQPVTD